MARAVDRILTFDDVKQSDQELLAGLESLQRAAIGSLNYSAMFSSLDISRKIPRLHVTRGFRRMTEPISSVVNGIIDRDNLVRDYPKDSYIIRQGDSSSNQFLLLAMPSYRLD